MFLKTQQWGAGVVICLGRAADLHMAQLMPLLLAVSCFTKIQIDSTFLVPAHPGSPGQSPEDRKTYVCNLQSIAVVLIINNYYYTLACN